MLAAGIVSWTDRWVLKFFTKWSNYLLNDSILYQMIKLCSYYCILFRRGKQLGTAVIVVMHLFYCCFDNSRHWISWFACHFHCYLLVFLDILYIFVVFQLVFIDYNWFALCFILENIEYSTFCGFSCISHTFYRCFFFIFIHFSYNSWLRAHVPPTNWRSRQ